MKTCRSERALPKWVNKLLLEVIDAPETDGETEEEISKCRENRAKAMITLASAKFEFFKISRKTNRIILGDYEFYSIQSDIAYYFDEAVYAVHTIAPMKAARVYISYGKYRAYYAKRDQTVKHFQQAIDLYQKAVEIDPNDYKVLHKIGLLYL